MTPLNISLKRTDSSNADFRALINDLDADLRQRNGEMMDIYDQHNIIDQINTVVIAYVDGVRSGCGCFKSYDDEAVEVKRMFVRREARGNGISKQILNELEHWAKELGFTHTVLETGNNQTEALALYNKAGYERISAYGVYIGLPDSVCFKKRVG